MKTYKKLATLLIAIENCKKANNLIWQDRHECELEKIMKTAPNGSGFDNGSSLIGFNGNALKFKTAFHHMDENGYYSGWTDHSVTVKPSILFDLDVIVSGKNKNGIKDHIGCVFFNWLESEIAQ